VLLQGQLLQARQQALSCLLKEAVPVELWLFVVRSCPWYVDCGDEMLKHAFSLCRCCCIESDT
jgi:hypothetical protein